MNYAHWHLMFNHFPIVGIVFCTAHLGGQIRHTEIRPGFVPTSETTEETDKNHPNPKNNQEHPHEHHHH